MEKAKLKLHLPSEPFNVNLRKSQKFYDYYVDFFGILLPGATFLSIFILIFYQFMNIFCNLGNKEVQSCVDGIFLIDNAYTLLASSIIFLLHSYVLGFLFFRRGPKKVDQASILTRWNEIRNDSPPINPLRRADAYNAQKVIENRKKGIGFQSADLLEKPNWFICQWNRLTWNNDEKYLNGKILEERAEWPYDCLYVYLATRLPHLAALVPWRPRKGPDENGEIYEGFSRSKHFMNILKENIRFYFPDKFFIIARNEAHVRLSCSVWYAARYLIYTSILFLILFFIVLSFAYFFDGFKILHDDKVIYLRFVMLNIFVLFSSFILKNFIQKFVFYQRIREIVYILNSVYQCCKQEPLFYSELLKAGIWPKDIF